MTPLQGYDTIKSIKNCMIAKKEYDDEREGKGEIL